MESPACLCLECLRSPSVLYSEAMGSFIGQALEASRKYQNKMGLKKENASRGLGLDMVVHSGSLGTQVGAGRPEAQGHSHGSFLKKQNPTEDKE